MAKTRRVRKAAAPAPEEPKKKRAVRKDTMENVDATVSLVLRIAEEVTAIPSHTRDDMTGLKQSLTAIREAEELCNQARIAVSKMRAPTFRAALTNAIERYDSQLQEKWSAALGDD
jgi:hypothetical protein